MARNESIAAAALRAASLNSIKNIMLAMFVFYQDLVKKVVPDKHYFPSDSIND